MTKHYSSSQLKSKLRQIEQKQRKAINDYNRAVRQYNSSVKKFVSDYNAFVRTYNAAVRKNKQIIDREIRKLNSSSSIRTSYTISLDEMQHYYTAVDAAYPEGIEINPQQSAILDLVEQEQANSLITANTIIDDNLPAENTEDIEIGNKLALISEDLNNRWKGAVFALNPNNPDATRHFCTSTREIFTEFLELKAPDDLVFSQNPNCAKTDRGNATRKEKIKYMMRNAKMDDSVIAFVDADINNILDLNHLLSGGTHGPAGKFSFEKLLQVKKRVEQGIFFLCEISA